MLRKALSKTVLDFKKTRKLVTGRRSLPRLQNLFSAAQDFFSCLRLLIALDCSVLLLCHRPKVVEGTLKAADPALLTKGTSALTSHTISSAGAQHTTSVYLEVIG